jgi:2-polyprenyl-6-methoxyphenol hydroxylase-like FAD-dependent oxidoreductase
MSRRTLQSGVSCELRTQYTQAREWVLWRSTIILSKRLVSHLFLSCNAHRLQVIIAGAGPAGLLTALLLGQQGIHVTVLESWDRLDERLRATQYGVPATRVFRKAGLMDDIRKASIESFPSICWRKTSTHEKLTGIDLSVIKDHPDRMTILPLNSLVQIMYRHCMEKTDGRVEVKFKHEVVNLGQDETQAWVDVKVNDSIETTRLEADYLIGCDGSKSVVRHCLFGRNWPGVTFDCHLLVQNVSICQSAGPTS